ncbi:polysaccharide pyruvyl transferase family protein [Rhodococcoides corynebacterioides]|uniref:polysaccharide pyruvyl transferase family protein n=3 Tax=Rhodococcoides corynebacterioides TaxID=53972 RepID=UPI000829D0D3|nr:polysaccharide pyruvyl transferase family protein [Rhodococcus corynebacterioides]
MCVGALEDLRDATRATLADVVRRSPVALLDHPHYFNAGDHLIYSGTPAYLNALGCSVDHVCAPHTYDAELLEQLVPSGPILLLGGGNFGDRWPMHQWFRERVVADFPHRRIVQLPQSFDFTDAGALAATRSIYEEHPDLTVLVRDREGAERTAEAFPTTAVRFCPDLAFGATVTAPAEPEVDIVVLARRDAEAVERPPALRPDEEQVDWSLGASANAQWWASAAIEAGVWRLPWLRRRVHPIARVVMDHRTAMNLDAACARPGRGRVVVTDRMHGGVLAALLGRPVFLVDNVNKKVSAIVRDYLGTLPDVELATDFADAMARARSRVGRGRAT